MTTRTLNPVRVRHHLPREEDGNAREQNSKHVSVMTKEVLEYLAPHKGEVVVDATYGQGGHSKALKAQAQIHLIAIDADPSTGSTSSPQDSSGQAQTVIKANFADLEKVLKKERVPNIDKALFDLGWNRGQLSAGKGFSFLVDEPLNMSYGDTPASGFTAREIVNTWSEKVLADVFFGYGEERYARRIAKAIVERRDIKPIETTLELAEIIKDAVPPSYRHGRTHPATKSFQALRIATNDELKCIERGLAAAWKHLACNGRIAVISFHSIEDRVVKRTFALYVKDSGRLMFKKPLIPARAEIIHNPSARSAKLRVIEKICKEK